MAAEKTTDSIDQDLHTGLNKAKSGRMFFALVLKGGAGGKLLVGSAKIAPSKISAAKKETGGSAVVLGTCFGEDGKLIFETPQQPGATWAKVVKSLAQSHAGVNINAEFRIGGDSNSFTDELPNSAAPPPAPSAPAQNDAAALFAVRFKMVLGKVKDTIAAGLPASAAIKTGMMEAQNFARKNEFAKANSLLDRVEKLAEKTAPRSATTAPPAPKPASGEAERFAARLKALLPQLIPIQKGNPDAFNEMKVGISEAQVLSRKADFAQANARLDQVEALLKKGQAPAPAAEAERFAARLKTLLPQVLQTVKANPARGTELKLKISEAQTASRKGELPQADALLDQAEALLKQPQPGPPPATGKTETKGKFVLLQQARLKWDGVRKSIHQQLTALERAILEDCQDMNDDPDDPFEVDLGQLASKVKTLYTVMDKLDEKLIDKLDEALNAAGPDRQTGQRKAVGLIQQHLATLKGDKFLTEIDNSGFLDTNMRETVFDALSSLAEQLAK